MASQTVTERIPNEIMRMILERLEDWQDILSQCLVSKRFHDIARPLLFRDISIGYYSIIPLTKIFFAQPNLAKEVQVLTVQITEMGLHNNYERYCASIDATEEQEKFLSENPEGSFKRSAFEHLSKKVDPAFKMFWLAQFPDCQHDVYLALLLTFLPNVEELSFRFNSRPGSAESFLQLAFRTVAEKSESKGMLGKLKKLNIDHTRAASTPSSLVPLLATPSLEEINMRSLQALIIPLGTGFIAPNVTRVRLDVTAFNIPVASAPVVAAIIHACPRLASFGVGYFGLEDNFDSWLDTVCLAIREREGTLETFSLGTTVNDTAQKPARFDSLTGFAKLKNLQVPEHLLLGYPPSGDAVKSLASLLPSGLETLSLTNCTHEELEPVISIVETGYKRLPILERVLVDFGTVADTHDDTVEELDGALIELAEWYEDKMGVAFSWKMKTGDTDAADVALDQLLEENA
ncbi:uncharacterized protein BKCO1_13000126 [Diplodia corticola]|uniref:F-box domain-containing protein n=1 Tax=Diplodia corticola TaxID=236234 RepID=A0A1J9RUE0_9PEZI|nr:uncharacterized protein BKCO1_13000126 [Diplodia corticola]OJD36195.1 hypothetical protein BKCO1_13000126 [Diplodia corticola]